MARFTFLQPAAQEFFVDREKAAQDLVNRLRHPVVGDLDVADEVVELAADSGLRLAIFTAAPGSRSAEALDLLASWAATSRHQSTTDQASGPPRTR